MTEPLERKCKEPRRCLCFDCGNLFCKQWLVCRPETCKPIKEFKEVDDKFVTFVLNKLCDYDQLKSGNIYEVKPV